MTGALAALLEPLGIDALGHAGRLPWLAIAALLPALVALARRRPALPWPALDEARRAGARCLEPLAWLSAGLRVAALLCLSLVLAEPVALRALPPETASGLDLMLVLDTSRSMAEEDALLAGVAGPARRTRLELAREAVARFAGSRVAEGDRVGLVVFGERAFTQCPLTRDAALLADALAQVEVGVAGESTALGDALALAVARGGAANAEMRVVVLLTDGRANAGAIPIGIAEELAAGEGVRVHTVAIGRSGDGVHRSAAPERQPPDHATLERIADRTGGRFFAARRSEHLEAVYQEIAQLERPLRPLPPRQLEQPRSEPLLAAAGALLLLEIGLARLLRRSLP